MPAVALKLNMPEEVEKAARKAALLSGGFLRHVIERELKRQVSGDRLTEGATAIRKAGFAPLTDEEVETEVHAARLARRMPHANCG